ncbi:alpha-amylase family glycosyl hydrolase [Amphiplicatus metriothermophilus]|uniref:Maltogenic amylase n=1 Tax=Amphiplicatus metriothermophilus TaxID=1519374 RepID=A0A239PVS8_9PROT|nr:alpha-amylase family glycosyl hydrolase [Amphiplicatus metriothermophilus]MBB5519708.1 glycosidase [Amphiplicatus metriothermophilus]SNT74270.1 maltogenic amylase [Amphiplicatus metriothermophilus]
MIRRRRMAQGLALLFSLVGACQSAPPAEESRSYAPKPYVEVVHPTWTRDAVIYQLNTRQFSEEGTFAAAQKALPRLKDLGVDIIWLMPVHPIGEVNRKGSLGSPYAVKDYYGVNPEFGTLEDLKAFIDAAHDLGMYVILDWVANHTAWDNVLVTEHPDWYERDWKGDFMPTPWWDWSDIIDLDYSKTALREYMAQAMKYWVEEVGVDGFRCDVAGYVPLDFWEVVRRELETVKPVFMLAEWEGRDAHARAFDATYAWSWNNAVHAVAKGEADVGALFGYYSNNESAWPQDAYRLVYISNHDQNAWEATQFERFGDALEAAIVLSVVGEGMPMIYNGQEAGNEKRLAFFEKDPIVWREHPIGALYRKLFALKRAVPALANGATGARMIPVVNDAPSKVLSFVRFKDSAGVFAVFNFSPEPRTARFEESLHHGAYMNYFSGEEIVFDGKTALTLEPWGYRVFVKARR